MKQTLIPKPDLQLSKKFNLKRNQSLNVLTYSNDELLLYLKSKTENNPFLSYHSSQLDINADAFLEYQQDKPSLMNEIMEQIRYSTHRLNNEICEYLISSLNSNGYFKEKEDVFFQQAPFEKTSLQHHLSVLRTFEPYGCFAFTLSECLKIQCRLSKKSIADTAFILCDYLEHIATKQYETLIQKTNLEEDVFFEAISFIKTLNPKPAANFSTNAVLTSPEFDIKIIQNEIHIALLNDDLSIVFDADENLSEHFRQQRNEVKELISNIKKRNTTLLQVMQCVTEIQKDFFTQHASLKQCTLQMVADKCGLHVSNISRAITNKTCEFDHTYYQLKYFFQSGGSDSHSKYEIKNHIITLIQNEDCYHPYSDEQLRLLLIKKGIIISRRAIAKYREESFIFNSTKRKKIK